MTLPEQREPSLTYTVSIPAREPTDRAFLA